MIHGETPDPYETAIDKFGIGWDGWSVSTKAALVKSGATALDSTIGPGKSTSSHTTAESDSRLSPIWSPNAWCSSTRPERQPGWPGAIHDGAFLAFGEQVLVPTLETVKEAVIAGELDKQLAAAKVRRKRQKA